MHLIAQQAFGGDQHMPGQRPGMSSQILEADSPHGQDRFRPDRVGLVATRLPGIPGVQAGQMIEESKVESGFATQSSRESSE